MGLIALRYVDFPGPGIELTSLALAGGFLSVVVSEGYSLIATCWLLIAVVSLVEHGLLG